MEIWTDKELEVLEQFKLRLLKRREGGKKRPPHVITRDRYWTEMEQVKAYQGITRLMLEDPRQWGEKTFVFRAVLGTGARIGELANLLVTDCHSDGVLILRKTKTQRPRQVRCTPEFMPYFQRRMGSLPSSQTWLIENPGTSQPYSIDTLERWWDDIVSAVGLRRLTPHAGRHTYASNELATKRMTIEELQGFLGHKRREMTSDFYLHSMAEFAYRDLQAQPPLFWAAALEEITRALRNNQRALRPADETTGVYISVPPRS